MQEPRRTRIPVADNHAKVRECLCSLLENQPDMAIICETEDGRSAVECTRYLRPDVVIMDIIMPNLKG